MDNVYIIRPDNYDQFDVNKLNIKLLDNIEKKQKTFKQYFIPITYDDDPILIETPFIQFKTYKNHYANSEIYPLYYKLQLNTDEALKLVENVLEKLDQYVFNKLENHKIEYQNELRKLGKSEFYSCVKYSSYLEEDYNKNMILKLDQNLDENKIYTKFFFNDGKIVSKINANNNDDVHNIYGYQVRLIFQINKIWIRKDVMCWDLNC